VILKIEGKTVIDHINKETERAEWRNRPWRGQMASVPRSFFQARYPASSDRIIGRFEHSRFK